MAGPIILTPTTVQEWQTRMKGDWDPESVVTDELVGTIQRSPQWPKATLSFKPPFIHYDKEEEADKIYQPPTEISLEELEKYHEVVKAEEGEETATGVSQSEPAREAVTQSEKTPTPIAMEELVKYHEEVVRGELAPEPKDRVIIGGIDYTDFLMGDRPAPEAYRSTTEKAASAVGDVALGTVETAKGLVEGMVFGTAGMLADVSAVSIRSLLEASGALPKTTSEWKNQMGQAVMEKVATAGGLIGQQQSKSGQAAMGNIMAIYDALIYNPSIYVAEAVTPEEYPNLSRFVGYGVEFGLSLGIAKGLGSSYKKVQKHVDRAALAKAKMEQAKAAEYEKASKQFQKELRKAEYAARDISVDDLESFKVSAEQQALLKNRFDIEAAELRSQELAKAAEKKAMKKLKKKYADELAALYPGMD